MKVSADRALCEDLSTVDERRSSMGMGPLEEYLGYFREEGDPPIRSLAEALASPERH